MNAATEAIISFSGQDKGLLRILDLTAKSMGRLNDATDLGISSIGDYENSASLASTAIDAVGKSAQSTSRTITGFSRVSVGGYRDLTNAAENTIDVADALDSSFLGLAARSTGVYKEFNAVNSVLQPTAGFFSDVGGEATLVGKAFTVLNALEKPLTQGLETASTALTGLAKSLASVDEIGAPASTTLLKLAGGLDVVSKTLHKVDTIGDIFQVVEGLKNFANSIPDALEGLGNLKEQIDDSGVVAFIASHKMLVLQQVAAVLSRYNFGVASSLSKLFLSLSSLKETVDPILSIGTALANAYIQTLGLGDALSTFESMGIDTTFATLALESGIFGENLLFNTEAAQKFAKTTITAFAQLEDSLSFVTTLTSGAELGIPKMQQALQDLVNGPLKNSITSQEASSSLYTSMSAGMTDLTKNVGFLETALKLSTATGTDANTTVEALLKTGLAYQSSSRDVGKIAGEINQVVEEGIVTLPQLAGGLAEVASVAAPIGVTRQELLGLISALTYTKGGAGALEGVASLLNSIAGQGDQSQQAIAELGIRFDIGSIKAKGLKASLDELYKATKGDTTKIKTILPDSVAYETAIALMTSASSKAETAIKNVSNAGEESVDRIFQNSQQSLIKQATALMNGFKEQMITFGERLTPIIKPALKFLQDVLDYFKNLPPLQKDLIAGFVLTNIAITKSIAVAQSFSTILVGLGKAFFMARLTSLAFTGQLVSEFNAVSRMITARNFAGVFTRLFGVDDMVDQIKKGEGLIGKFNTFLTKERLKGVQTPKGFKSLLTKDLFSFGNTESLLSEKTEARKNKQDILENASSRNRVALANLQSATALTANTEATLRQASADRIAAINAASVAREKEVEARAILATTSGNTSAANAAVVRAETELRLRQSILSRTIEDEAAAQAAVKQQKANTLRAATALEATQAEVAQAAAGLNSASASEAEALAANQASIAKKTTTEAALKLFIVKESEAKASLDAALASLAARNANLSLAESDLAVAQAHLNAATQAKINAEETRRLATTNIALAESNLSAAIAEERNKITELDLAQAREVSARSAMQAALTNKQEAESILQVAQGNTIAAETGLLRSRVEQAQVVQGLASTSIYSRLITFASEKVPLLGKSLGFLDGAFTLVTNGAKMLWASFGPITLAIGAVTVGFMALQDFIPVLGGAASESEKLNNALLKVGTSSEQAAEKGTQKLREYTGFINNAAIPIIERFFTEATKPLDWIGNWLSNSKFSLSDAIKKPFTALKDSIQDYREAPEWDILEIVSKRVDTRLKEIYLKIGKLKAGDFMTDEAQKIAKGASGRSLTAEENKKILDIEADALKKITEENDKNIAQLEEGLRLEKNLSKKAILQQEIDLLKTKTSLLEQENASQKKYLENTTNITKAIEENNAALDSKNVRSNTNKKRKELEQDLKNLPDVAKDSFRGTFNLLDDNLNLVSNMQRRKANSLVNATKDFMDNIKAATSIKSYEELTNLRRDADNFLQKIDDAVTQGTIGEDIGNKLRQQILNQTIEIPKFNIKGSALSDQQIQAVNKSIMDSVTRQGDFVIHQQELTVEKYKSLEATKVLTHQEVNVLIAKEELNISKNRLKINKDLLKMIKQNEGERSQAYKNQLLEVNKSEIEVEQKKEASRQSSIDERLQNEKDAAERATAIVNMAEAQGVYDAAQASQRRSQIKELDLRKQIQLQEEEIAHVKSLNGSTVKLETDLANLKAELAKNTTDRIIYEYERQKKVIANTGQTQNQLLQASANKLQTVTSSLQLQQKLMESQNSLYSTRASFAESEVANVTKLTSSAFAKAGIEVTSSQLRLENLNKQQVRERELLVLQEKSNALAIQKDIIQNKIAQSDNTRQIAAAKIDLLEAKNQGKPKEELDALKLQITSLEQNGLLLRDQSQTLETTKEQSYEIAANSKAELQLKQEQARDGGTIDIQIAKQNLLVEKYNKQKELLEKQQTLLGTRVGFISNELDVLAKVTKNEEERKELSTTIALNKLNTLKQQAVLEQRLLEFNIAQQDALLKQEEIRNRIAFEDNKAKIADTKTELIEADAKGASLKQKKALFDKLQAYLNKQVALIIQGKSLEEQQVQQSKSAALQQYQQQLKNTSDYHQGLAELAGTLAEGQQEKAFKNIRNQILLENTGISGSEGTYAIKDYNRVGVARYLGTDITGTGFSDMEQERARIIDRGFNPNVDITTQKDLVSPINEENIRRDTLSVLQEFMPLLTTPTSPTPAYNKTPSQQKTYSDSSSSPVQVTGGLKMENTIHIHVADKEDKQIPLSLENTVLDSLNGVFQLVKQRIGQ